MTGARPKVGALALLVVSGVIGFRLGATEFPTWHVAVETAQVLAGLVHYPPDNPVYIYHTKLWTILHQISAVLLRAGLSEITVSVLVSGVLGMISVQALTLFVYALSQNAPLALGLPFVVMVTRAAQHGVVYPIWLMGTPHTYGAVGLSLVVLVAALFGSGAYRIGGLLLGFVPAVHPSLGAWLWFVFLIAFLADWRALAREFRPAFPFFVAGCLITAASLGVQLLWVYDVPTVDPAAAAAYLTAFTQFWDAHRQPVEIRRDGVAFNRDALLLAMSWLILFRSRLPRSVSFLLRVVVVCAAAGGVFVLLSWLPPERLPPWLLLLMPARLLNFDAFVFAALVMSLAASLASFGRPLAGGLVVLMTAAGLLISQPSMLWEQVLGVERLSWLTPPNQLHVLELATVGLFVLALVEWRRARSSSREDVTDGLGHRIARASVLAVFAVAAVVPWPVRRSPPLVDRTNNVLFKVASEDPGNGLLATGSAYSLIQLRTRRPVLLDSGALDTLSYAPESGPEMARILRDVYEIDLLHPPKGVDRGGAAIPPEYNKRVWESFSRERWQAIKRTYHVSQVLTSADHELQLPVAAQFASYRLYRIPD